MLIHGEEGEGVGAFKRILCHFLEADSKKENLQEVDV
jgi:hypothetical protein